MTPLPPETVDEAAGGPRDQQGNLQNNTAPNILVTETKDIPVTKIEEPLPSALFRDPLNALEWAGQAKPTMPPEGQKALERAV